MGATAIRVFAAAPLRYAVSAPSGSPASTDGWPVLCFLHGHHEGAPLDLLDGVTRHGPLRGESWPGARERFVIVAPQLPVAGDHWHEHAETVVDLVTRVGGAHGGDRARTYLTGFSFGGNGVLDLALAHPEAWAALWAVDPTRVPRGRVDLPLWLSLGEIARPLTDSFVSELRLASADEDDGNRLWEDDGLDHVTTATRAYARERTYRWLLARRAPPAAVVRAP